MKPVDLAIVDGERSLLQEDAISATPVETPPAVDGNLSDSCWETANFRSFTSEDGEQSTRTEFAILRDTYGVYIAIRCYEPDLSNLVATCEIHDGLFEFFRRDDWVEVLIDPGNTGHDYYWFLVNSEAMRTDLCAMADPDRSWNGEWQAGSGKEKNAWTVEMFIPFATFNRGVISDEWRMNVARLRVGPKSKMVAEDALSERTVWSGVHRKPKTWPTLKGVEQDPLLYQYETSPVTLLPSKNPLGATLSSIVRNPTDTPITLQPVFRIMRPGDARGFFPHGTGPQDTFEGNPITLPPHSSVRVGAPIQVNLGETILAHMLLFDRDGNLVHATPDKGVTVQALIDGPGPEFNFYTSESTARLRFDLQESGKGLTLSLSLKSQGDEYVYLELDAETSPVYVDIPLTDIPLGIHSLQAELIKDGHKIAARSYPLVRWLPLSEGSEVKINHWSRSFQINGEPFVPMGNSPLVMHGINYAVNMMREMAANGLNTMQIWRALKRDADDKELPELDLSMLEHLFTEAKHSNLKILVSFGSIVQNNPASPFKKWDWSDAKRLDLISQVVEFVKHRPELFGYEIVDEPEFFVAPEWAERIYQTIQKLDPYHPAMINTCRGARSTLNYAQATDSAGLDYYPAGKWPISTLGTLTEEVVQFGGNKPVKMWIQGYKIYNPRAPTPAEVKAMTYMTVARGVSALFYFIGKPPEEELWQAQGEAAREMQALSAAIVSDRRETLPTEPLDSPVYASFRSNGNNHWVITINESDQQVDVTIPLPSDMANGRATVLFESRNVEVHEGNLSDQFKPWERHVYEINPQNTEP